MKREDGYYWATYFGHDKIVKLTTVRPNYQIYYLIDESKFCLEEDLETIDEHPIKRFAEANPQVANTVLGDVADTDLRCCGNCSYHTCIVIGNHTQNELCKFEFKSDKPRKHRISNEICSEWIYDGLKHNERLIEYKSHIT